MISRSGLMSIIAIIVLLSLSHAVNGVSLTGVKSPDNTTWCWAACVRCASLYYAHNYSQREIVKKCCEGGDTYIYKPVDYGCDCFHELDYCAMYRPNDLAKHLKIHEDWSFDPERHVQEPGNLITLSDLESHTNTNPAIAGFVDGTDGHAVVIGSASESLDEITVQ